MMTVVSRWRGVGRGLLVDFPLAAVAGLLDGQVRAVRLHGRPGARVHLLSRYMFFFLLFYCLLLVGVEKLEVKTSSLKFKFKVQVEDVILWCSVSSVVSVCRLCSVLCVLYGMLSVLNVCCCTCVSVMLCCVSFPPCWYVGSVRMSV